MDIGQGLCGFNIQAFSRSIRFEGGLEFVFVRHRKRGFAPFSLVASSVNADVIDNDKRSGRHFLHKSSPAAYEEKEYVNFRCKLVF